MDGRHVVSRAALDGARGHDRIGMAQGGRRPQEKVLSSAQRGPQGSAGRTTTVDDRPQNPDELMENQPSFDLSAATRNWRENLAESANFRADDLDELESHLQDSVRELATRGLSAEEAFSIAIRRIGPGQALAAEFGRVNGNTLWIDRLLWMLLGAVFVAVVRSLLESLVLLTGPNNWRLPFVFLICTPLILALLAIRSLTHSRGTVPRVLTSLLQRPLGLSLSFLLLGLFPVMLKILAFSRTLPREVAAVTVVSLIEWVIVALFILVLARKRLRQIQT